MGIAGIFGLAGAIWNRAEAMGGLLAAQTIAIIDYIWAIVIIGNCDQNVYNPIGPCVPYVKGWDVSAIVLYFLGIFAIIVSMTLATVTMKNMQRKMLNKDTADFIQNVENPV